MPYYAFCNICAAVSTPESVHYFLNCGHVLCKNCQPVNGNTTYACSLCKKQAKVVKLDELPDQLKNTYFVSDLKKILEDPIKIIEFQQAQEQKTLEIINNYQERTIKMEQLLAKEIEEAKQLKAYRDKLRQQRIMMQKKLLEIKRREEKSQLKAPTQRYRERNHSLDSLTTVSGNRTASDHGNSFAFTPKVNQQYFSNSSGYATSTPNKSGFTKNRRSSMASSSSGRTPFFA